MYIAIPLIANPLILLCRCYYSRFSLLYMSRLKKLGFPWGAAALQTTRCEAWPPRRPPAPRSWAAAKRGRADAGADLDTV